MTIRLDYCPFCGEQITTGQHVCKTYSPHLLMTPQPNPRIDTLERAINERLDKIEDAIQATGQNMQDIYRRLDELEGKGNVKDESDWRNKLSNGVKEVLFLAEVIDAQQYMQRMNALIAFIRSVLKAGLSKPDDLYFFVHEQIGQAIEQMKLRFRMNELDDTTRQTAITIYKHLEQMTGRK